jgi:NCAIR mutase (PurE)-related protein
VALAARALLAATVGAAEAPVAVEAAVTIKNLGIEVWGGSGNTLNRPFL